MDPEEKKMLERLLTLSENNNRLLRRMRREVLWGRFFRLFYLLVIVGVIIWGYFYFQPYLGGFSNALQLMTQLKNVKLPSGFSLPQ